MKLSERQIEAMTEYGIPGYMQGGLRRYYEDRRGTGDFLSAVLSNDLLKALSHADLNNRAALHAYAMWLFNQAPIGSYGSPEAVEGWLAGTSECYRNLHPEEAA